MSTFLARRRRRAGEDAEKVGTPLPDAFERFQALFPSAVRAIERLAKFKPGALLRTSGGFPGQFSPGLANAGLSPIATQPPPPPAAGSGTTSTGSTSKPASTPRATPSPSPRPSPIMSPLPPRVPTPIIRPPARGTPIVSPPSSGTATKAPPPPTPTTGSKPLPRTGRSFAI